MIIACNRSPPVPQPLLAVIRAKPGLHGYGAAKARRCGDKVPQSARLDGRPPSGPRTGVTCFIAPRPGDAQCCHQQGAQRGHLVKGHVARTAKAPVGTQ
jgi:hypothetical protein